MPTLRDAIARFDAANAACQIPDRKRGGFLPAPMPRSRRDPIVSNAKIAVEHLVAAIRTRAYDAAHETARAAGADALDANAAGAVAAAAALACPADILELELDPFLVSLPAHAGGQEEARKDRQKRESNVKLFVSVVAGIDFEAPRRVTPARVHEPWKCLYKPLFEYAQANRDKRRNLLNGLLRLQDLLLAHGIANPAGVPDRIRLRAMIADESPEITMTQANKRAHWLLGAYRTACRVAGLAETFPQHYDVVEADGVGIRSLPDWVARARALGFDGDPHDATVRQLIALFAPRLHLILDRYLRQGESALRRPAWINAQLDMASWVVASLIRAGVDPFELHWPSLFLERQSVEAAVDEAQDVVLHEYFQARGRSPARGAQAVQHSLLRRCLDVSARQSWASSPLRLINPAHELDAVPRYTEKHESHLDAAFVLTREMYGRAMQAAEEAEIRADWGLVQAEYEATLRHIVEYNKGRPVDGRKDKAGMLITWPQAICMGLPYLRAQALALRVDVEEARARRGHLESRASRELLSRYDEALREWMIATIMLDDGLRVKNYAGARAHEHVKPIVRKDATGRWTAVIGLTTHWRGRDHPKVSLKMAEDRDGNPRKRDRQVTPALLDTQLLSEYWMGTRVRAAVSAGLLTTVDAFDPESDRLGFIVTPRPRKAQHENPDWYGDMTPDMVSEIFGRALYRICREVLKLELPAWDSCEITTNYRALFSAHVTRIAVASYVGGLRGDWPLAEELTDDEESTLRKPYSRIQKRFAELKHVVGTNNPHHFDAVIDRMFAKYPEDDWATFWRTAEVEQPDDALRTLVAASEVARHGLGSVAARRRARSAARRSGR